MCDLYAYFMTSCVIAGCLLLTSFEEDNSQDIRIPSLRDFSKAIFVGFGWPVIIIAGSLAVVYRVYKKARAQ